MGLSAFVGKLLEERDGDVVRERIRVLAQALMETEVAGVIGRNAIRRSGTAARGKDPRTSSGSPTRDVIVWLVGAVLAEQDDGRALVRRYLTLDHLLKPPSVSLLAPDAKEAKAKRGRVVIT